MENKYQRDPETGALINKNNSAYASRILAKKRAKIQEEEIKSLKEQIEELKEIVNTLITE